MSIELKKDREVLTVKKISVTVTMYADGAVKLGINNSTDNVIELLGILELAKNQILADTR